MTSLCWGNQLIHTLVFNHPGFTLHINIQLLLFPVREHLIYTDIQASKLGLAAWCDVAWSALNPGAHWGTPRSHRPQFPRNPMDFHIWFMRINQKNVITCYKTCMYVCMYVCIYIYIPLQTCGKVSSAQNPCWLMSSEILLTNILGIITSHEWKIPISIWGPNYCKVGPLDS